MLEKIRATLGDDLAKQVEAKLGSVELGITNDGSLVPAEKHDNMKQDMRVVEKERDEFKAQTETMQKDIDELALSDGTIDELKQQITDQALANDKFKADTLANEVKRTKDAALEQVLRSEEYGVDEKLLPLIRERVDYEKITTGAMGELIGVAEVAQALKTEYPTAFTIITKAGTPPGQPSGHVTTKQQLIDLYNDAQKKGNTREMATLQTKIKNYKEE